MLRLQHVSAKIELLYQNVTFITCLSNETLNPSSWSYLQVLSSCALNYTSCRAIKFI